jgi:lipopolysaccharide biosynthesis glycosyltransferase
MKRTIWVGFEPRELDAFKVCLASIRAHLSEEIEIHALALDVMVKNGMYHRQTVYKDGQLYDVLSEAPMSTEFAISRFFIPHLCRGGGLALFMDCDMLVRCDLAELFALADPRYAVQVVKHEQPPGAKRKMDNQIQTAYPRKNWSSVMLWNLDHRAHRWLHLDTLNRAPGRALHEFAWLNPQEIGELEPTWNHLVGINPPDPDAKIVHYTLGIPRMEGYEQCEHADEWRQILSEVA